MTIKKAFEKARAVNTVIIGDAYFALVGWRSPETKQEHGPFLVTVYDKTAVEVERTGRFREIIPATADCYFPWLDTNKTLEEIVK